MTLLSRILGFVRDILMASVLGTGLAADAFFAAFRFPNLFRRIFAEGAFNAAFIPMFAQVLEKKGEEEARLLAGRIISWLAVVLLVLTILAEIFMPSLMRLFVPGFVENKEKFEFSVLLTRICFPYLMAMSLMAAYGAILNGMGKFLAAAFAPVMLNIIMIGFLIVLVFFSATDPKNASFWLAIAIFIGGIAQFALVYWAVKKMGMSPKFVRPRLDKDVKKFWFLALPVILSGGVTQINLFIGTIIASTAGGAISILYYADRLYQLPLGLIGIAIGVVLLPELSRHLKGGRDELAQKSMDQSMHFALLLTLPATAGLIALAHPIISTLFERGVFDAQATILTSNALVAFSFGLPAFVLIKLFQPGFFARSDTKTPTYFAIISVVINITLSLVLFPILQHVGIAIATTIAAWSNLILLSITLFKRGHFKVSKHHFYEYLKIIFISIALTALLLGLAFIFDQYLSRQNGFLLQAVALGGVISFGMGLYFIAIHFSKVQDLTQILMAFKKAG